MGLATAVGLYSIFNCIMKIETGVFQESQTGVVVHIMLCVVYNKCHITGRPQLLPR